MAQAGKGRLNYEYYCLRCQYTGKEKDVLEGNEMVRTKYGAMYQRFTKFDFD